MDTFTVVGVGAAYYPSYLLGFIMTPEQQEEFRWAYSINRTDMVGAPPIQFFDRVASAKSALLVLQNAYPEISFGIFVRGDQLYLGHPEVHELIH